ncbi:MAG: hypothetical protein WD342_11145 [Verrucomicrobiales bacterium]
MNREPVNPDDPELTAYALGELNAAEKAEFEVRLQSSPQARRELESMSEVMSMLSTGLKNEWEEEMELPVLQLVQQETSADESNHKSIVPVTFRDSRRVVGAIAAALAVMLVVVGTVSMQENETELALADDVSVEPRIAVASDTTPVASLPETSVHVPRLFLAEEIDDLSGSDLDLAEVLEQRTPGADIDASYLEATSVIPASHKSTIVPGGGRLSPAVYELETSNRVDSYLPPVDERGGETGMIDLQSGKTFAVDDQGPSKIFVRGYVTMGEESSSAERKGFELAGFRPVAMSGNPVFNDEHDLQILAQMRELQSDLSRVIAEMPEGSSSRLKLEHVLEKSRRVTVELNQELSR